MRVLWLLVGLLSLGLGFIGVAVPLLPTTPFVLLAAFAFMRSSKRLHDWLLAHRTFGPLIANWRRYGAISLRAKVLSVLSMLGVIVVSLALSVPRHVVIIQVLVLTASAAFIVTRPLPPKPGDRHGG